MKDIQTVACFNTHSPILHLFYQSNAKYITLLPFVAFKVGALFSINENMLYITDTGSNYFVIIHSLSLFIQYIKAKPEVVLSSIKSFIREATVHFRRNNSHVE